MKVTDVKTFVVANPPPHYGGPYWIFVKLTTDSGVVGYGEVYSATFHPRVMEQMIVDLAGRHLIGKDPFRIEHFWRTAFAAGYSQHADITVVAIISGLEIACWDIIGKELGKPVYELLGGRVHEKLRAYTYLYPLPGDTAEDSVYNNVDKAARKATEMADLGFTAVKFDPAGPYTAYDPRQLSLEALERSEQFVKAIREAVGTRCDMLFGTHGQMTPSSAIRLAKRLEPYDPLWLEEPTPPGNVEAMAQVARSTSIPIATGERLATKYDFAALLKAGAASILQMALGRVGGILEGKKIAGMAEAHFAQIAPHLYCGPIEAAANIQLDTCSPNFLIQEAIGTWDGFHSEILKKPLQIESGFIIPSKEPGIGVELDEEVAENNPYSGDILHLNPSEEPLWG